MTEPTPDQVLAWMAETNRGIKAAAKHFELAREQVRQWKDDARTQPGPDSRAYTPARTRAREGGGPGRLARLQARLATVDADLDLCRSENKVTALAHLHAVAMRAEDQIATIEEAQADGRDLEADPLPGLLADLARLPQSVKDMIVQSLVGAYPTRGDA